MAEVVSSASAADEGLLESGREDDDDVRSATFAKLQTDGVGVT